MNTKYLNYEQVLTQALRNAMFTASKLPSYKILHTTYLQIFIQIIENPELAKELANQALQLPSIEGCKYEPYAIDSNLRQGLEAAMYQLQYAALGEVHKEEFNKALDFISNLPRS